MDLRDKIILITGSTDGIGKQCALDAANEGAEVIVHGRNEERLLQTINLIKETTGNENIFGVLADFSSLAETKVMINELKSNYSHIDILINNAAELLLDRCVTGDGFETQFQVNYLAHFLITEELLPLLNRGESSRIINVSSMIHSPSVDFDNLQGQHSYNGSGAYALTKTLNILHAYDLADRIGTQKTGVFTVHPGVIETKLLKTAFSGGAPISEGADNVLYVAKSDTLTNMTGLYIENRRPMQSNPITYNKEFQVRLREISFEMIKNL
jgi:NAD(P)-dependent dehydrogenase (short-subunit alcohol dehydrogenase family)